MSSAPTDAEIESLTVKFKLVPRRFEPIPDFVRLRAKLEGRAVEEHATTALEAAKAGDDAALRDLAYQAQRLCFELASLPKERVQHVKDRMDYWPELVRLHAKGRTRDEANLWNQYALNALSTLREAHTTTLELMRRINGLWTIASGGVTTLEGVRKSIPFVEFPLSDGRTVRVASWKMVAMHLALWPIEDRQIPDAWWAAETSIREFWKDDTKARDAAFAIVRCAAEHSGNATHGRLLDAALKEIKRAFRRILEQQIADTVRAIGPNGGE